MNTNNWSSYVNSIFDLCNLDNFENQTTCSIDLCYEKFCDIENINWYQKLNFKPKLRTYKLFKNNKLTESMLSSIWTVKNVQCWLSYVRVLLHFMLKLVVILNLKAANKL